MKKEKSTLNQRKVNKVIFIATLMALPIAHYLVFWLYVNIQTVWLSFQRWNVYTGEYEFYWFTNYITQWKDVYMGGDVVMHRAFLNGFNVWGINAILIPLAIFVSYTFHKRVPGEKAFRVIFYIPHMISVTTLTLCFRYMFTNSVSTFVGPAAQLFNALGLKIDWWDVINPSKVVWPLLYSYSILFGLGTNVILMSGAMNRIPKEVIEAGKLDGIGFWRELFNVTIPLTMPTISTFILSGLTGVMGYGLVPMLLVQSGQGGSYGQAYTMGWFMFEAAKSGDNAKIIASTAIGVIFSCFMMPLVMLVRWILNKLTPDVQY